MKKLIQLLLALFIAFTINAQTTAPAAQATEKTAVQKQVQNPAAWACPKCYMITKAGGKCAHCDVDKVQLGTYYCQHCIKATGNKPGKCSMCGSETTQMTRKLCAKMGGDMPMKHPASEQKS